MSINIFKENELIDLRSVNKINSKKKILTRTSEKIKRIVFHCTDADGWTPERLNRFFLEERKFPTCGYHYYVTKENVYQMVSPLVIAYHASGHNSNSISFSIDFPASFYERLNISIDPTLYMQAVKTCAYLCLTHKIYPSKNTVLGHSELLGSGFIWVNADHTKRALMKTCPGLTIDLDEFRLNVVKFIQSFFNLSEDGIFGPKSKEAFDNYILLNK